MPTTIRYKRERVIIAELVIDLHRHIDPSPNSGSAADLHLILCAIAIGQFGRTKLMRTANIASYLGIPRTTVIRKLKVLVDTGWIEEVSRGQYRICSRNVLYGKPAERLIQGAVAKIQQACLDLSKVSKTDT